MVDEPTCDEPHCDDPTDEVEPVGFALAALTTERPAPHRAHLTPTPAVEHPSLDAPPAPTPTPHPVLDRERAYRDLTVRPEPIRVQVRPPAGVVDQNSSGGGDAGRLEPAPAEVAHTSTPVPLVPDTHREAWVLDQLLDVAAQIRDSTAWVQPTYELVSDMRVIAQAAQKRDEARVRDERDLRAAELERQLTAPAWRRALASPHAQRAFGLVTWLGGAVAGGIACGVADYLGLETEPVIRFFAQLLGGL